MDPAAVDYPKGPSYMNVIERIKNAFDRTPYEPESDKIIRKGEDVMSQTRRERMKLQSTLRDPGQSGFFLGDSLIIDRKNVHEPKRN